MSDTRFRLSYARPTSRVSAYKVIHIISAVNRRCNEVFELTKSVLKQNINKRNSILISPKNKTKITKTEVYRGSLN